MKTSRVRIVVDRQRPFRSAVSSSPTFSKPKLLKKPLTMSFFGGRDVVADDPLRAEAARVCEDVVHREALDAALQHPAAHQIFVDLELLASSASE